MLIGNSTNPHSPTRAGRNAGANLSKTATVLRVWAVPRNLVASGAGQGNEPGICDEAARLQQDRETERSQVRSGGRDGNAASASSACGRATDAPLLEPELCAGRGQDRNCCTQQPLTFVSLAGCPRHGPRPFAAATESSQEPQNATEMEETVESMLRGEVITACALLPGLPSRVKGPQAPKLGMLARRS